MTYPHHEVLSTPPDSSVLRISPQKLEELITFAKSNEAQGGGYFPAGTPGEYDVLKLELPSQHIELRIYSDGLVHSFVQKMSPEGRMALTFTFEQDVEDAKLIFDDLQASFSSKKQPELSRSLDPRVKEFTGLLYRHRSEEKLAYTGSLRVEFVTGEIFTWDGDIDAVEGREEITVHREYQKSKNDFPLVIEGDNEVGGIYDDFLTGDAVPPFFNECSFEFFIDDPKGADSPCIRFKTPECVLEAKLSGANVRPIENLPQLTHGEAVAEPFYRFSASLNQKKEDGE